MFELTLKLHHDCSYLKFSELFGKKQMFAYCSRMNDILIIPEEISEEKLALGKRLFTNSESWKIKRTGKLSIIIMDCYCSIQSASITVQVQKLGGMPIYPVKYENNWEYHKIFTFERSQLEELLRYFQAFPQFTILSLSEIEEDSLFQQMSAISEVIDPLTKHQLNIIIKAFENGLYSIPRKTKPERIAKQIGLSRYGFQKVLRTAENKLMKALIPFFYFTRSKKELPTDNIAHLPIVQKKNKFHKSIHSDK